MTSIEITASKGWNNLWLETDSKLAQLAFKSHSMVPWYIKNRWTNCLDNINAMNFFVSLFTWNGTLVKIVWLI